MCAHMLGAGRQRAGRCVEADEVHNAGDQKRRVHGAVLPVLQVAHFEAAVRRIQIPAGGQVRVHIPSDKELLGNGQVPSKQTQLDKAC